MSETASVQLPLPLEPETVTIALSRGQVTVVDAADADLADVKWSAVKPGRSRFYAVRWVRSNTPGKARRILLLHRVILERVLGRELVKGEEVDHIDCNPLNNCRSNLRLSSHAENMRNVKKNRSNTSGYKGVHWSKDSNKWVASIKVDGKRKNLGGYATPEEAYAVYCEAARKYHGEFARLE